MAGLWHLDLRTHTVRTEIELEMWPMPHRRPMQTAPCSMEENSICVYDGKFTEALSTYTARYSRRPVRQLGTAQPAPDPCVRL